jgi:hypothetical protein
MNIPHDPGRTIASQCNPCSKKDDTLLYEKRYKIIVGSATDKERTT